MKQSAVLPPEIWCPLLSSASQLLPNCLSSKFWIFFFLINIKKILWSYLELNLSSFNCQLCSIAQVFTCDWMYLIQIGRSFAKCLTHARPSFNLSSFSLCVSHVQLFVTTWIVASVHGILQARILEWVTFSSLGDLPNPGIQLGLPHCRQILYHLSHQGNSFCFF